jgi:hypothetical protein
MRRIEEISDDGIITLADGTVWRVAPPDLGTLTGWRPEDAAQLWGAGPTRRLHHVGRRETVSVTREGGASQLPSWWARRAAWRGSNNRK